MNTIQKIGLYATAVAGLASFAAGCGGQMEPTVYNYEGHKVSADDFPVPHLTIADTTCAGSGVEYIEIVTARDRNRNGKFEGSEVKAETVYFVDNSKESVPSRIQKGVDKNLERFTDPELLEKVYRARPH